jgi:legumain
MFRNALLPLLAVVCPSVAEDWAVIAVGSSTWWNYRHQADGCHAYHVLRAAGIPADHIIVMMQDDIANNPENPIPGTLYNRPGDNSPNVYDGCMIDYRGDVVTKYLFLQVITGNSSAGGPVLQSGPEDRVFLNFVDHGGVGIVAFPNGPLLTVSELSDGLETMKQKGMYDELVFYMEACESGSMFPSPPSNAFALTAANADESSWATYCTNNTVNGIAVGTCLGDLFSVSWMEYCDHFGTTPKTIQDQVSVVTKRTSKSHVETFGDTSLEQLPACSYASAEAMKLQPMGSVDDTAVLSRNVPLKMALAHWQQAKTPQEKKKYHKEYLTIVRARAADDEAFSRIVNRACRRFEPNSKNLTQCEDRIMNGRSMLTEQKWFCHTLLVNTVHETCPKRFPHNAGGWNGYNMKYGNAIVNICENSDDVHDLGSMEMTALKEIVTDECGGPFAQVVV